MAEEYVDQQHRMHKEQMEKWQSITPLDKRTTMFQTVEEKEGYCIQKSGSTIKI